MSLVLSVYAPVALAMTICGYMMVQYGCPMANRHEDYIELFRVSFHQGSMRLLTAP